MSIGTILIVLLVLLLLGVIPSWGYSSSWGIRAKRNHRGNLGSNWGKLDKLLASSKVDDAKKKAVGVFRLPAAFMLKRSKIKIRSTPLRSRHFANPVFHVMNPE